ncbi:MAG TPA: potassium-transporting ATPase subunit KdpA [Chloroflexota bacterium]|jgi:K+-transporting ATPase ATPase A chain|nr:potassium-transporting ATPase subunit KdpA [Chloroflexota bacterium]
MPAWMTGEAIWVWAIYSLVLLATAKPLGLFLFRLFTGQRTFLHRVLRPVEVGIYRLTRVDEREEMSWYIYLFASLAFSLVGLLYLYILERTQQWHGSLFNPQGFPNVPQFLGWNTAVSFLTNTNWQNYSGESTMSYLTQMSGLAFHNFVSAAAGIVWAVALVRGLARRSGKTIGSFWVDLVRCIVYLLMPITFFYALFLVWQGVPDNLMSYTIVHTLLGTTQTIAQGPVALQEAAKMLGTNGGGFFNANSAHPFENPTPFSNFIEILSILLIGSALVYMFGKWIKDTKQGWAIWGSMFVLFTAGYFFAVSFEQNGNHLIASKAGVMTKATANQPGGNMEGKEVRYGIVDSALFATATTDASEGAVNSWHDSYTPLGGLVPLTNIATGEVIFGGVGAGLYGMLMYVILAVFIAGLMVGRTPEYLGKKIESFEVKMASIALLISPANILIWAALAVAGSWGAASILNPGPHGLTEILYAYTSMNGNNGSAFGGLSTNTNFYNLTGGVVMLIGRFLFMTPLLAIAGSMAGKKTVKPGLGTFPTNGPTFGILLVAVIIIVAALTYLPAYSLGPILEQLRLNAGITS